MNKSDLIDRIATASDVPKALAGRMLDTLTETIMGSVKKGEDVTLVGFGTFKLVPRAKRAGHNPKTGEKITIAATKVAKFTPGSDFKAAAAAGKAPKK